MDEIIWAIEPGKGVGLFELGVSRADILRRLNNAGLHAERDEGGSRWYYVKEMDADLTFSEGSVSLLEEIAVSDDRLRIGPLELINEAISKVVDLLRVADDDTQWTLSSDAYALRENDEPQLGNSDGDRRRAIPTSKSLLREGTLWIRSFGLGLVLVNGHILTARLRQPGNIPLRTYGPLTDDQRTLAAREALARLRVGSLSRYSNESERRRDSRFQLLAGLALVVLMAVVIWQGIDYQRRWDNAPLVDGEVIDTSPPPPEPFPRYFTIAYRDQQGRPHQAVLDYTEIFSLSKIGAKVQLRYLPEAPDKPKGSSAQRAAFDKYIPWGLGVFATYFVLQFVMAILRMIQFTG
jgi:hypothetical protein